MVVKLPSKRGASGPPKPTGPFAALAGPSRQAAWRRALARRLAAVALVAIAVVLLLTRPGPLGAVAGDPAPKGSGDGSGLFDAPGGSTDSDEGTSATDAGGENGPVADDGEDPSSGGPSGAAGTLGVVRIGGLRGAASVPADAVGISLPALDDSMAARLRPGDVVDVYASGRKSPVARAARVIEVIALRATSSGVPQEPGQRSAAAAGGARVFLTVTSADISRVVSSARASDAAVSGFWFAVRGAPDVAASAR